MDAGWLIALSLMVPAALAGGLGYAFSQAKRQERQRAARADQVWGQLACDLRLQFDGGVQEGDRLVERMISGTLHGFEVLVKTYYDSSRRSRTTTAYVNLANTHLPDIWVQPRPEKPEPLEICTGDSLFDEAYEISYEDPATALAIMNPVVRAAFVRMRSTSMGACLKNGGLSWTMPSYIYQMRVLADVLTGMVDTAVALRAAVQRPDLPGDDSGPEPERTGGIGEGP